jgi:hypothetical protein
MPEDNFGGIERKNSSLVPHGGLIPGQTGPLTVGRKITLNALMLARIAATGRLTPDTKRYDVSSRFSVYLCSPPRAGAGMWKATNNDTNFCYDLKI